tara:strand:- start:248488 stop:250356 length:1869 start_codon:yes stop_codon:yes gene_type:complete
MDYAQQAHPIHHPTIKTMHLKIYNTLSNQLEAFVPTNPQAVTFYSCGPTVYDDAHIGNFRSFLAADLLRRWIESPLCVIKNTQNSNQTGTRTVTQVMNITDVGHMTDDENADGAGQDKMEVAAERILKAKKLGNLPKGSNVDPQDPFAIARYYENRFKEDAIELGLKVAIDDRDRDSKTPTFMPRATDNIDNMKTVIEQLLVDGFAYPAGEPGNRAIYFDVQRFKTYGQLSGNSIDQLKGGAGGRTSDENTQQKKHQADFLLWKEDASHKMKWSSPIIPTLSDDEQWGEGYPGWHIECTAMALARLATDGLKGARDNHAQIDLHSGGEDNIFPHHECEIAQSCCFTGNDSFAKHWFHPRFLKVEGEKMSKSKGTMYTLRDLTAKGIDPAAIRLELIKTHYRANADFSMQGLRDSAKQISNYRDFARLLLSEDSIRPEFCVKVHLHEWLHNITDVMSNDLNIASAIGWLHRSINDTGVSPLTNILHLNTEERKQHEIRGRKTLASSAIDRPLPDRVMPADVAILIVRDEKRSWADRSYAALHLIDGFLGVIFRPIPKTQETSIALYQPGVTPSEEIESLLIARRDAKASKDWSAADAIRDQLTAMGLSIMDKPEGQVEVAPVN